jgi:hypothetical protein
MRRAAALSLIASPLALAAALPALAGAPVADAADGWDLLGKIEFEERETATSWSVIKRFPAELEGGVETFEISGYLTPVGWEEATRDFMLVSDAGQCPFCGSGEHGTAIEVRMTDPLPVSDESRRVTLRGALHPVRDETTLQAVVMTGAEIVDG